LGEKFIELDNWKYERFTEVTAKLYRELAAKECALKRIHEIFQETKKSPFVSTMEASTMTETSLVKSLSKILH